MKTDMNIGRRVNRALFRYGIYGPDTFVLGRPFFSTLRQLEVSQYWSEEELCRLQERKLKSVVEAAVANVPYYRDSLADVVTHNWSVSDLPLITKDLIRDRQESFLSEVVSRTSSKTTGGSTGQPVTIVKSGEAMGWEQAGTWRAYRWAGLEVGDSHLRFWGVPLDRQSQFTARARDFLLHRRRCSAFAFDEADLDRYYKLLCKFRPSYLYGYVSMLEEFARFISSDARKKVDFLTCVISTSEVLSPPQRQVIEDGLGCNVFNEYGCGEFGSIAHECEHGSLHITSENVIVESMKDGEVCAEGEVGELVVTELNNSAMPLIRYCIGDFGAVSKSSCRCGRHLPVLDNLFGRAYDTIINSEGRKFHGEFFLYILEGCRNSGLDIRGMQVIQKSHEEIEIKIVADSDFQRIKEFFTAKLSADFDEKSKLTFTRVSEIERERSGKMRLIVGCKDILDDRSRE